MSFFKDQLPPANYEKIYLIRIIIYTTCYTTF